MPTGKNIFYGNIKSPPVWAGDFGGREHVMPFPAKIDASQFTDGAGITVTLSAGATGSATSLTVTALTLPLTPVNTLIGTSQGLVLIPSGTVLDFGGQKFARLHCRRQARRHHAYCRRPGHRPLLRPTPPPTPSTAPSTSPPALSSGRTYAERDASTAFGAAAVTDDEIYLSLFDVTDAKNNDDVELYRHGSLVKENYLPTTPRSPRRWMKSRR
jgi:hypothetical protein